MCLRKATTLGGVNGTGGRRICLELDLGERPLGHGELREVGLMSIEPSVIRRLWMSGGWWLVGASRAGRNGRDVMAQERELVGNDAIDDWRSSP